MASCKLEIRLDRADRVYAAGEPIAGTVEVRVDVPCDARGLTLTRGWSTDGDGDRVAGGRMELRLAEPVRWMPGSPVSYPFTLPGPAGPLTYEGERLAVRWQLEARADIPWGVDPKAVERIWLVAGADPELVDLGPEFAPPAADGRPVIDLPGNVSHYPQLALAVGIGLALLGGLGVLGQLRWLFAGYVDGFWLFVSALMLATGGTLLYFLFRHRMAEVKLGPVRVEMDEREVLAGDSIRCRVGFRASAPLELVGADMILLGREVVTGTRYRGRNPRQKRVTYTRVAVRRESMLSPPRGVPAGETVALEAAVAVPADAPPTFMALDNELRWVVRVRLRLARWPGWLLEYPITVRPAPAGHVTAIPGREP